jgi:hypothetical protein
MKYIQEQVLAALHGLGSVSCAYQRVTQEMVGDEST